MSTFVFPNQPEIPKQPRSLEHSLQWTEDTLVFLYKLLHNYQIAHFTLTPNKLEHEILEAITRLHILKAELEDKLSFVN